MTNCSELLFLFYSTDGERLFCPFAVTIIHEILHRISYFYITYIKPYISVRLLICIVKILLQLDKFLFCVQKFMKILTLFIQFVLILYLTSIDGS